MTQEQGISFEHQGHTFKVKIVAAEEAGSEVKKAVVALPKEMTAQAVLFPADSEADPMAFERTLEDALGDEYRLRVLVSNIVGNPKALEYLLYTRDLGYGEYQ